MPLPRATLFDSSTYSARRIVFVWIAMALVGWAVIFYLVKGAIILLTLCLG